MNILITGAGLVGCNFAREMKDKGHSVVIYDLAPSQEYIGKIAGDVPAVRGDIRDLPALLETMQKFKINGVLHTAGLIAAKAQEKPRTGFEVNVLGTLQVVEAARLSGVECLVFTSTMGVYDMSVPTSSPISEEFPLGADSVYTSTKVACEQVTRAYSAAYGFKCIVVRLGTLYGYGHYVGGSGGGMTMHEIVATAAAGKPVRINKNRVAANDFTYAKDAVQGIVLAFEKPIKRGTYNLTAGGLSQGEDIAAAIRANCPGLPVELVDEPTGRAPFFQPQPLDISKARKELGYEPKYDLTRGIGDFIKELQRLS